MKVFVLLPSQHGLDRWQERARHEAMPDSTPYGYHHAAGEDVDIEFSRSSPHGWLTALCKRVFHLNLVHIWRHRRALYSADVVWTHTEHEHLAALLLFTLLRPFKRRPRLIAQCIWLFDDWQRLRPPLRRLCAHLLGQADVITVHSRANLRRAQELLPRARVRLMPFGVSLDAFPVTEPRRAEPGQTLRLLAPGNDRDRDWDLLRIFAGRDDYELFIASSSCPPPPADSGIRCLRPDLAQLKKLYHEADVVIVPLKENSHASGLTVILEAVALGVPVVCSDTGGLRDYFGDDALHYFTPGSGTSLLSVLQALRADPQRMQQASRTAQRHLLAMGYSSQAWALRHVALSRQLCAGGLHPLDDEAQEAVAAVTARGKG